MSRISYKNISNYSPKRISFHFFFLFCSFRRKSRSCSFNDNNNNKIHYTETTFRIAFIERAMYRVAFKLRSNNNNNNKSLCRFTRIKRLATPIYIYFFSIICWRSIGLLKTVDYTEYRIFGSVLTAEFRLVSHLNRPHTVFECVRHLWCRSPAPTTTTGAAK